jgi:hypothetical protein
MQWGPSVYRIGYDCRVPKLVCGRNGRIAEVNRFWKEETCFLQDLVLTRTSRQREIEVFQPLSRSASATEIRSQESPR